MDSVNELLVAVEHLQQHRRRTGDPRELALMLYGSWYARPYRTVKVPEHFPSDLIQVLRASDATARVWDGGWSAEQVLPDGRVIARRGKEVRMADLCDYVATGAVGVLPRPGDALVLAGRRDRFDSEGGWWQTGGQAWLFTRAVPALVRLYWNIELARLPELVTRLTVALADEPRPWMVKCAIDPTAYARADATVLYLPWAVLEDLSPQIDAIAAELQPHACSGAPPLALPICPGVAVAVDPSRGESFGEHRCRLIVEALLETLTEDAENSLSAIGLRMAAEGIDVDRPHASRTDPMLPWET